MLATLALLLLASPQDPASEEAAELEEAAEPIKKGEYESAESRLGKLLEAKPGFVGALRMRARMRAESGNPAGALADAEALLKIDAKDPVGAVVAAKVLARSGKYEEALDRVKEAAGASPRMAACEVLDALGRGDDARAMAKSIADASDGATPKSLRELLSIGRAYERLAEYEAASECYAEVGRAKDDPLDPLVVQDAITALGDLYARVYRQVQGRPGAEKEYKEVLEKRNANHIGALLGRYRIGRTNFQLDGGKTERCLEQVLEIDPTHPEALLLRADSLIDDRRFEEAERTLEKILAANERDSLARAQKTALLFLRNRTDEFGKESASQPLVPRTLGAHLKALYRFADAIPFLEEAVKKNANDAESLTALGECLAHTGREAEARKKLEEADALEVGFAHPWRSNMIKVLTALEKEYVEVASPSFKLKVHPDAEPVIREMLPGFYEKTRKDYGDRYGYLPPGPVTVELMQAFDDFSVRTIGFTGFGALGVCFGNLITSVSPTAVPFRGNFSYLDTAWHEYAHVVHIGLSKARVPRWFTEGLATLEEVKRNPAFDRHMELDLLEARAAGQIFPVLQLNSAFRGPRILFGYYQGGLLCEFLEKRTSPAKLVEALTLFGRDLPFEEVLLKAFGMGAAEIDREFLAFVDRKLEKVRARPQLDARTVSRLRSKISRNAKDLEALRSLAWAHVKRGQLADAEAITEKLFAASPDDADGWLLRAEIALHPKRNRPDLALERFAKGFAGGAEEFFSRLRYAQLLEKKKDFEGAKEQLRAAIAAFPSFADPALSPHLRLAAMLAAESKMDESAALLEEFCKIAGAPREPRLQLAARYEAKGDLDALVRVLGELLEVDPFDRPIQRRLALAHLELHRFDEAALHARLAGAVKPQLQHLDPAPGPPPPPISEEQDKVERGDCKAIEAEALAGADKIEEARKALAEALKLDPENERAAELKTRLGESSAREKK